MKSKRKNKFKVGMRVVFKGLGRGAVPVVFKISESCSAPSYQIEDPRNGHWYTAQEHKLSRARAGTW